jgi:hypothetical protein
MATIVLVHGIAQQQYSADTLEATWLPALAGGVRNDGNDDLADQLWRNNSPSDLLVRMAYYGDRFLAEGAQGADDAADELSTADLEFAENLAETWLRAAAEHAANPADQLEAKRQLTNMTLGDKGAMGPKSMVRPALNGLARLKWFAPFGVGLAGKFVWRAVTQVTRYLGDDTIRAYAQDQVLRHIGPETRLVIGHSLGSVVAYEALHRSQHRCALLTLGSPLGLRNVIYDRLLPQPPRVPRAVTAWHNLVDRDDLVAAHLDLSGLFPAADDGKVRPVTPPSVDNGSKPHDASNYLNKRTTGRFVSTALT